MGAALCVFSSGAGPACGVARLLERARTLERSGAWREALEEYRRLKGVAGDEADQGIARCRRQLRIALRSRSTANRDFAKKLSAARGLILYEEVLERIKKYNAVRAAIKKVLKEGPKTVPEIASATGIPSPEVLWHVMSMKKYGLIAEHEDEMDYYSYRLAEGDETAQGE